MGILKRKIRSLSLPLTIALILMHIIKYNKGLIEKWDRKKCFNKLGLQLLCTWSEDCKTFCPMSHFMDSFFLKGGPIGSETSVRIYHYSLRTNPEERISEGGTVLWNTGSYWPNDTVSSKNTGIVSVTTVRTKPLVFYSLILYLVCLMTLFIAKFNTELECGRKSLWLNLICL